MHRKMKERYATPTMECTQIEAEGTFAGSIVTKEKSDVTASKQDYHEIDGNAFDEKGDFDSNNQGGIRWE